MNTFKYILRGPYFWSNTGENLIELMMFHWKIIDSYYDNWKIKKAVSYYKNITNSSLNKGSSNTMTAPYKGI